MDAATRAELDALRRRAYSPSADIGDDADAVSRLVELEELALPATGRATLEVTSADDLKRVDAGVSRKPLRVRPRRHGGLVAGVALVAAALGMTGGLQAQEAGPARNARAAMFVPILIDDSTGDYVDVSMSADVPVFPVSGAMRWAQSLGEHFGWALWIGGAPSRHGDQNCILLVGDTDTRSQCAAGEWEAEGALVISLSYPQIPEDERPQGMAADQSVAFRWTTGGYVSVRVTPGHGD